MADRALMALARLPGRIGKRVEELYGQPGREVTVDPFGPGEASVGAFLARLPTAVFAGMRREANARVVREQLARQIETESLQLQALRHAALEREPVAYLDAEGRLTQEPAAGRIPLTRAEAAARVPRPMTEYQRELLTLRKTLGSRPAAAPRRYGAASNYLQQLDREAEAEATDQATYWASMPNVSKAILQGIVGKGPAAEAARKGQGFGTVRDYLYARFLGDIKRQQAARRRAISSVMEEESGLGGMTEQQEWWDEFNRRLEDLERENE